MCGSNQGTPVPESVCLLSYRRASEGHREHKQQLANSNECVEVTRPHPERSRHGPPAPLSFPLPAPGLGGEGRPWMCVRSGPSLPEKAVALAVVLCVSIGWTEGVRQPHPPPAGSQDGPSPPGKGLWASSLPEPCAHVAVMEWDRDHHSKQWESREGPVWPGG